MIKGVNTNAPIFEKVRKNFAAKIPVITSKVAVLALNFFLRSFREQGSIQKGGVRKWEKRHFNMDKSKGNRAVLTKTSTLKRSLREMHNGRGKIHITSNMPYSEIMNDGGRIKITPKMRRFFWAMYYEEGKKLKYTKAGAERKSKGNTRTNEVADIWKGLALTKQDHFDIIARPFIYDSEVLVDDIGKFISHQLDKLTGK